MVLIIVPKKPLEKQEPTVFDSTTTSVHLDDIYNKCPWLFEEGKKFALKPCRTFAPENVLYVRQKEDAVTFVGDKLANGKPVQYCGTQDVLTCHVVVLHHPKSKVTAIAHYDEYVREKRLFLLVKRFQDMILRKLYESEYEEWNSEDDEEDGDWEWVWEDEEEENQEQKQCNSEDEEEVFRDIQLKLIGGLVEDSGKGLVLSRRILTFFAQHQLAFSLNLCCLGPANTKKTFNPKPLVGGCVCNISNGMVFPADFNRTFVDKLPDEAIKTLMLGPSLIKKPNKLKQMILAQEDKGFSTSNQNMGPIRDI